MVLAKYTRDYEKTTFLKFPGRLFQAVGKIGHCFLRDFIALSIYGIQHRHNRFFYRDIRLYILYGNSF